MENLPQPNQSCKPADFPRLAEYHFLKKIRWQIFGTLTFKGEPSAARRKRMSKAFFSELAKSRGLYLPKILRCLREEGGDATNERLPHFHFLIAGVPKQAVSEPWCRQLRDIWEKLSGGIARIAPYDRSRDGVGYILKCSEEKSGDHRTDSDVFGHPCKLMLSDSLSALLKRRF